MTRMAALLAGAGMVPGALMAQSVLPSEEVLADTYIRSFPDTGARIAVFEAGQGFREELFERDVAGVFDTLQPGQPPLLQADIIVARVDDWEEAAEVYDGTALQALSETVAGLAADQPLFIQEVQMFGDIPVLTFTFLNEARGEVVHARCMARVVVDTLYNGGETGFDLAGCSRELH